MVYTHARVCIRKVKSLSILCSRKLLVSLLYSYHSHYQYTHKVFTVLHFYLAYPAGDNWKKKIMKKNIHFLISAFFFTFFVSVFINV